MKFYVGIQSPAADVGARYYKHRFGRQHRTSSTTSLDEGVESERSIRFYDLGPASTEFEPEIIMIIYSGKTLHI
jgi:hypothetical protein